MSPSPSNPNAIRSYWLTSLCPDESGLLWIGTEKSGVEILNIRRNIFEQHQTRYFSSASSFLVDPNNSIWVGISDDGLMKMDASMHPVSFYKFRMPGEEPHGTCRIYKLFSDSDNDLWVGDSQLLNQGLFIFNEEKTWFEPVSSDYLLTCETPRTEEYFFVNAIEEDREGNFWFGTDHGLYTSEGDNKRSLVYLPFKVSDSIFHIDIWDLWIDANQGLWIATDNYGLLYFSDLNCPTAIKDGFDNTQFKQISFDGSIFDICTDNNEVIWLATSCGLFRIDFSDTSLVPATDSSNLVTSTRIYNIAVDNSGFLWMDSHEGLIRFNPAKTSYTSTKKYTKTDGLPFDQYQSRSFYQATNGRIFLGGIWGTADGFLVFNPNDIKDNRNIPEIAIIDFRVNQKPFKLDSVITAIHHIFLEYDQNFFSFEFAALDYVNPELNQYAYYLEGLEDEWIEAGNRRYANYTDVSPGNYTFRVKGSNNDGYWNETGTSLMITILPPPWRTWWAYTLYGLAVAGLLFGWRRYDLRRQRLKQALEIEHLEGEKLKELDTMKSRFFANISHEFRTPLTLILGPLEKIKASVSEEIKNDLTMVQRNARRLQNLINQLLNLSKLEAGEMKLVAQEVNITDLIRGYTHSFESLATQKGIKLSFETEDKNIMAWVDKDKMERILYNLLSNAFKFTGDGGGVTVTVSAPPVVPPITGGTNVLTSPPGGGERGGAAKAECFKISVTDTGSGIDAEKLPHIFDRFYQANDTNKADSEGSGIGLALTRELVELHHGIINVSSEKGAGTEFAVYLPVGDGHLAPEAKTEKRELKSEITELITGNRQLTTNNRQPITDNRQPKTDSDKPALLIVEDNNDLRSYIRSHLDQSYSIIESEDGKSGFESAIEQIPDLVISDVMMPEMDGFELCEKLKTDERTSHIPVILLTARAGQESKLEGLEIGADDYITKPFDSKELIARINNLLETRRNLREYFQKEFSKTGLENLISIPDSGITSMEQKFLQKTIEIIQKNLSDPDFTVKKLCSEMAMSNMQLHRKLVAITGQTANRFIRACRLKRAAMLLEKRAGNVTEVAYEVGFNNLSWFAKCFQEQFGISPSEYASNKRSQ
jgi:signal transduction histidine kinase/DNA-binding response OmpR family regulator